MSDRTYTKKSLGQHWLDDAYTLNNICEVADIAEGDHVLEIGPGTGSLTERLLNLKANVVAVEKDDRLTEGLNRRFVNQSFKLYNDDILKFDLNRLEPGYKVVANIPYYLTSNLLMYLCSSPNPFSVAVLLVQKEVAERVAAATGKMSVLSVKVQLVANVSLGDVVPAHFFVPPPKVASQILILRYRNAPYKYALEPGLHHLINTAFSQKRKTISNSLSRGLHLPREAVETALYATGLSPFVRPQSISLDQWERLYELLSPLPLSNNA